jgi:hypothetical protein
MIVRFNEANSYFDAKEIVTNIKEICKDLSDEYISFRIEPSTDIRIKMLGLYLHDILESPYLPIENFYVNTFSSQYPDKQIIILEALRHLESYAKSEHLKFNYELYFNKLPLPEWTPKQSHLSRYLKIDKIDERIFDIKNPVEQIKIIFSK